MKKSILLFVFFQIFSSFLMAQEKFDVVTFTAPKGWQKETGPKGDVIRFTKEDAATNAFCMITIFKAIPAGEDSKVNFDAAWEEFAQKTMNATNPQMSPSEKENGWEILTGFANFQKEGLSGVVLLSTASAGNKMVNILMVMNSDVYQKEMEAFFASVKLKPIVATKNNTNESAHKSKNKPELWVNWREMQKNMTEGKSSGNLKPIVEFYVIYPNGDYFPNVPWEGLTNFDQSYHPESWGKFTMQGNKGKFKNKYDEISVTKVSETKMEQTGLYNYGFYKCLPVDGLRLDGAYNFVSPNWGKDSNLNYLDGSGCQFVIYFKKDGTFDDKGIFYTGPMPSSGNCNGGKGTYSIENFTITFKYNDGRIVYRLFSLPGTRNPATYDETIYLGETPYYKKQ